MSHYYLQHLIPCAPSPNPVPSFKPTTYFTLSGQFKCVTVGLMSVECLFLSHLFSCDTITIMVGCVWVCKLNMCICVCNYIMCVCVWTTTLLWLRLPASIPVLRSRREQSKLYQNTAIPHSPDSQHLATGKHTEERWERGMGGKYCLPVLFPYSSLSHSSRLTR